MTFTPYPWQNLPLTTTPLDASHLQTAEQNIVAYFEAGGSSKVPTFTGNPADDTTTFGRGTGAPISGVSGDSLATPAVGGPRELGVLTIFPEDPQWAGGADKNTADATAAFQAIIDYLCTNHILNVEIRLGPSYTFTSACRTDRQGNAQVALPTYNLAGHTLNGGFIRFKGAPGGTTFTTTLTGQSYSGTFGPPSVIGGPTKESAGGGLNFANFTVEFNNCGVTFPSNPTLDGWHLAYVNYVILSGQTTFTSAGGSAVQPTVPMCGVRLPEGDNAAMVEVERINAHYCYAAVVANSAHMSAKSINAHYCYVGLGITGNTQYGSNDGHSSIVQMLLTQECTYHIASFSPASGAISLPAGDQAQIVIGLWDIEDGPAGNNWYNTAAHLLDANSQLTGVAQYARVVGNVGLTSGQLTISGGAGFGLVDRTQPASTTVARSTATTAAPNETTIVTGGSVTIKLPLAPTQGTRNRIQVSNGSSGSPTISTQSTDTLNHYGTTGTSLRLQNPLSAELEYMAAQPTTLATALTTGGPITSMTVAALPTPVIPGQLLLIASGVNSQTFTVSASAAAGATAVSVTSQTPNFAYPIGSSVAFGGIWNVVRDGYRAGFDLGTFLYAPGARASYTVAAGTLTALDTTNLKYQVLAPPNGVVEVEVHIDCEIVSTGTANKLFLGLLNNAGGAQVGNLCEALSIPGAGTVDGRAVCRFRLTGLTAGTLFTFNLAACYVTATGSAATVYAQGTSAVSYSSSSPAILKGYAA